MNQPSGYLIARNKAKTEFFISSSAYDRPQWKPVREATVYPTVDMAERALTKLLKQGLVYEARLVPLQEATFNFPNGEQSVTPNRGKFAETPGGNAYPNDDTIDDPSSADAADEMTADNGDNSDVCSACGHEPCTCEHSDEDGRCPSCGADLGDDQHSDELDDGEDHSSDGFSDDEFGGDEPPMGTKERALDQENEEETAFSQSKFARGQSVLYKGAKHTVVSDDGTGVAVITPTSSVGGQAPKLRVSNAMLSKVTESDVSLPAKPQADAKPTETNTPATKVDKVKFKQPAMTDDKFDQGGDQHDEKVKVPSDVMSDLKAAIAEFNKGAEFNNTRDDAKASFMMTTAEAMKTLLAYLELGTVEGIKQAQVSLTSMMSPITSNIPTSVLKFIHKGGKKSTLKDLFDSKRSDKKNSDN